MYLIKSKLRCCEHEKKSNQWTVKKLAPTKDPACSLGWAPIISTVHGWFWFVVSVGRVRIIPYSLSSVVAKWGAAGGSDRAWRLYYCPCPLLKSAINTTRPRDSSLHDLSTHRFLSAALLLTQSITTSCQGWMVVHVPRTKFSIQVRELCMSMMHTIPQMDRSPQFRRLARGQYP